MTDDTRHAALSRFVADHLGTAASAPEPASSDASFRRYWRVRLGQSSRIIMDAPPDKEDCRPFIEVSARLVAGGLRAPRVLAQDLAQGFLLLDDLGNTTLLQALDEHSVQAHYRSAMDSLQRIQRVPASGLPAYDANRLRDEMELLPTWYLSRHLGLRLDCGELDELEAAFSLLIANALEQPQVFVHRDYHSRNLMVEAQPGAELGILDFQDAVRGPITYDLVSLLKDCYVRWPAERVSAWAEGFRWQLQRAGMAVPDADRWLRWFELMGLQRHLKVLGIFARLYHRDGKPGYLADLPRVHAYALEACARYDELRWLAAALARWSPPPGPQESNV